MLPESKPEFFNEQVLSIRPDVNQPGFSVVSIRPSYGFGHSALYFDMPLGNNLIPDEVLAEPQKYAYVIRMDPRAHVGVFDRFELIEPAVK